MRASVNVLDSAGKDTCIRAVEGRTENSSLWQASLLILFPGHFWQGGPVSLHFQVRCKTKKTSSEEEGSLHAPRAWHPQKAPLPMSSLDH